MKTGLKLLLFLVSLSSFAQTHSKKELLAEIKKIEVSVQIGEMMGADQAYRFSANVLAKKGIQWSEVSALPEFKRALGKIDAKNASQIKKIIAKWGWPKISEFGPYTSKNVWLLIQHMDQDVKFQESCLKKMEALLPLNEVNKADFGYLYDRVQANNGKPQRYGTQGKCVGKNQWQPKPIENPDKLDAWRAEMEMPPMSEYTKTVQEICFF